MRVDVHTTTRFWLLDLAQQLHLRDVLGHFFTCELPLKQYVGNLPLTRVRSLPVLRLLDRGIAMSGLERRFPVTRDWVMDAIAASSALCVGHPDVLVHMADHARAALRKCARRGVISVISHGNTHPLNQNRWVHEACHDAGVPAYDYWKPSVVGNALAEYAEADYIEVPTQLCADTFVEQGIASAKLLVNPFSVDTEVWKPRPKPDPRRELRFLFAGAAQARKGVAPLLEAWRRARPEKARLYFALTGIWEDVRPVLHRQEGAFTVLRYARQSGFRARINDFHVLVMPSYEEGLSFALLQGMACALAPLCSDRSGGQEVLRDGVNGLVVRAGDVEGIEAAIRKLCDDRELAGHLGDNARKVCLTSLTPHAYGERALANYREVLRRRGKGS